ncbi:uncharacterized protein LOC120770686 [Bactrocera tryoni]|uniref:uncharacterized protein LOC120770686 n=1 Tax=Bactrocera tryoni TaxID=59916 RepID=UPI001A973C50|nr:uncharacterized protein LOC120770686 [Bactrocera tryoni]
MSNNRKRYNLSLMSEEAIQQLMNSVVDDDDSEDDKSVNEEDFDSDDEVNMQLAYEDFEEIDHYIDHLYNASAIDLLSSAINISVDEPNESTPPSSEQPSTSSNAMNKTTKQPPRRKRARSPLPQIEEERGYAEEFVGTAFGVDITSVLWKDTKCVRLVSTYAGVKPFCTSTDTCQPPKVTRFDRKKKEYVDIDCPTIVKEYNRHMGGVDLLDGVIGRYHIRLKTKKWAGYSGCQRIYHLPPDS